MNSTKDEFLEILSNYQGILYKVSLVYFKNKSDREDNLQEIIYQLWKSFPYIKNHNSIGSWIYAVSINTSISRVKKVSQIEYRETVQLCNYLINNVTLGIISIISLISGLLSWHDMKYKSFNLSLKDWLKERINILSKWLTGKYSKLHLILIPLLHVLSVLSIHVYYENKSFIEVLKTEDSVIGLLFGAPIGLFVSYFAVKKIRKYQLHNLEFLKDMYGRLCNLR